jgi:hypothetical protein
MMLRACGCRALGTVDSGLRAEVTATGADERACAGALPCRHSWPVYGRSSFVGSKADTPVGTSAEMHGATSINYPTVRRGVAPLRADAHTDAMMDRLVRR